MGEIDSCTRLTGLFGHPVGHSLSPLMHNRAFQELGLPYLYAAFDIEPSNIASAVESIRALGLRGVNVTIPHKVAVMPFLDEIDEEARQIGAVNTIVNENGRLIGYNTDGRGYVQSLIEEGNINPPDARVLMLGAGGAARGVSLALLRAGVERVVITNRTYAKAEQLAVELTQLFPGRDIRSIPVEQIACEIKESTLLVQTTSIGMHPDNEASPIPAEYLHSRLLVSDLIYNPLQTRIQRDALAAGARIHSGVGMFIYQGALSFEYWTGRKAPVHIMREAVLASLTADK
ncbi:shikimate dehydrogenase [Aneurinibacillus sp. Ricciae_BoGa-3]|nr:shikimate dehydrogenase [Aneurinibacillus sp. Ricciae_BoGa-3]WCK56871.1 shikimate dehydrogenase [Aneurinibacillus sp. Ricciae_BoGa-3]